MNARSHVIDPTVVSPPNENLRRGVPHRYRETWRRLLDSAPEDMKLIRVHPSGNIGAATLSDGNVCFRQTCNQQPGFYTLTARNSLASKNPTNLNYPDMEIITHLYDRAYEYYRTHNKEIFYTFQLSERDQATRDMFSQEINQYNNMMDHYQGQGNPPQKPPIRSLEYFRDLMEFLTDCDRRKGTVIARHEGLYLEQWPDSCFQYPRGFGIRGVPLVFDPRDLMMAFDEIRSHETDFYLFHNAEDPLSPWFFVIDCNNFTCVFPKRVLRV